MSDIIKRVCDSCRKEAVTPDEIADARSWPLIGIASQHAKNSLHACWACIPKMVELFPNSDIHLHCRYEMQVECTSDDTRAMPGDFMTLGCRPGGLLGIMSGYRLEILDQASDWIVTNVTVGNRHQFQQNGDVPGDCFAPGAAGTQVTFENIQSGMDFVVSAKYVGKNPEGAQLRYRLIGMVPGIKKATDPEVTVIKGNAAVRVPKSPSDRP